jgi:hypothetical protein
MSTCDPTNKLNIYAYFYITLEPIMGPSIWHFAGVIPLGQTIIQIWAPIKKNNSDLMATSKNAKQSGLAQPKKSLFTTPIM